MSASPQKKAIYDSDLCLKAIDPEQTNLGTDGFRLSQSCISLRSFKAKPMATYTYETIPSSDDETVERFEIKQGMMEDPLQHHPSTGKPIRRVITGGLGYAGSSSNPGPASSNGGGGC